MLERFDQTIRSLVPGNTAHRCGICFGGAVNFPSLRPKFSGWERFNLVGQRKNRFGGSVVVDRDHLSGL